MQETFQKQIPWPRILAEGLVIIVSILLALAADAWLNERQLKAEEREALGLIQNELAQVSVVLDQWQSNHESVAEAARILLENTGPTGLNKLAPEKIAEHVYWFIFSWTIDPPDSALASLESSGRLGLISNQELLTELATWQSLVTDLQGDENNMERYLYATIYPYIASNASWRNIIAYSGDPNNSETPTSFPDGLVDLLSDREFEGQLSVRLSETLGTIVNYVDIRSGLLTLQEMIDNELN